MPPVVLVPPDPDWANLARRLAADLKQLLGPNCEEVHHIGSTSIPGIWAKPIVDLLPVVSRLEALDAMQPQVEAAGYQWYGEYGLEGRRLLLWHEGPRRVANIHCYQAGAPGLRRHLAFRDYLRSRPELAREYEQLKLHCSCLHIDDVQAYNDCKNDWIRRMEEEALKFYS